MTTKPQQIIDLEKFYNITLKPLAQGKIIDWDNQNTYKLNKKGEVIGLYLDDNKISDLSALSGLTDLTTLLLINNQISDLSALSGLTGLTALGISNNQISDLRALSGLTGLTMLWLYDNQISDLRALSGLTGLTMLWLNANKISDLRALSGLTGLTELYLDDNQISDLNALSGLTGLTDLGLNDNQISDLSALSGLTGLTELDLSVNQISDLSALSGLIGLTLLRLDNNQISNLRALTGLTGLLKLWLHNNQISDLRALSRLTGLTDLNFSGNQISDLRPIIIHPNFKEYKYGGNPLQYPPKEIADLGYEKIMQWYKESDTYELVPLYEAKLLVVGEPAAGKTSLSKKLLDPKYKIIDGNLNETIGLNIFEGFEVPYNSTQNIKVHIWDFGGQDKQYPLHQYFLKGKSAYALLSLDREDNRYLDRWFSIIRLLAGIDNKINLVLNQKNRTSQSSNFDKIKYQRQGFNFQEHIIDLSKDEARFEILKDAITGSITNLNHVGAGYPSYCKDIAQAIDEKIFIERKDYLTYEEYEKLCVDAGYKDTEVPKKALDYLDIIGKVVYYEDDNNLNNIIIINPHWIIDAIYAVITYEELDEIHQKGRFTQPWLETFLKKSTPNRPQGYKESETKHILNLMLKNHFDICYSFDKKNYLIPLCMPKNIENFQFDYTDALSLIFKYEVMPSGMVARVLVRMSDYIQDDLISSTAGVLSKENCTALIEEYYLDNDANSYIRISVKGSQKEKKYFLNEIRNELLKIQKSWFDQLQADELIPCNCSECNISKDKYYISKDQIERYLNKDKPIFNVQCTKSGESVNIFNLLGEVMELKISENIETIESLNRFSKENPGIIQNLNIIMRDKYEIHGGEFQGSQFGGKRNKLKNYFQNNPEYQELKQLIQELKEQIKDNEAWHQYFNDVMDNLEALENAENEEKLLQEKTKSKSLFDKLKRTHDWINNIGIPTNLIDKIEKFKELFEKLPDLL